jgi:UDP-glucose 4-epimerase
MSTETVLVVGATGFLGAEVVRHLSAAGFHVRATGRRKIYSDASIEYYQADILNPAQLANAMKGSHTIIHAAGLAHTFSADEPADRLQQVNVTGSANVMRAAADLGAQHFILISSVSVYGPFTDGICKEDDPCRPVGPYAESRYNSEQKVLELAKSSGMAISILRLSTLYGEGDPGNINHLISWIDKGCFIWLGRGLNRKSLLYKGDAARACLMVASHPAPGINIFNVSAPPYTMREIVGGLAAALGKKPLPGMIPASLALRATSLLKKRSSQRLNQLHSTVLKWLAEDAYDTHLFEDKYNFRIETHLTEGLKRQVDWYRRAKSARPPVLSCS